MSTSKRAIDVVNLDSDEESCVDTKKAREQDASTAPGPSSATASTTAAAAAGLTTPVAVSEIIIPSQYRNPAVFMRPPKKDVAPQPVRIPLPKPFVGTNSLLIGALNGITRVAAPTCKIAGFDFDDTLSERKAAGGKDKWKSTFWNHRFASAPAMLRALHARGFQIVVCTNESVAHLKNAQPLQAQLTPKLERLAGWAADVGVPVLVLVATDKRTGQSSRGQTFHKQPVTPAGNAGMWHMAEELLGAEASAHPESFFVGDAAGRETDHGDDDRRLAASAGVHFHTEDHFFGRDPLGLLK